MTISTTPQFPDVHLQLSGQDGNVFAIIGRVRKALLNAGATRQQLDCFENEVTSASSYDAALVVVMRWVHVMSSNTPSEVKVNAIAANLKALHALLSVAAARSAEGCQLIQSGECNGAIGTVLELAAILDDAKALYEAATALHRLRSI